MNSKETRQNFARTIFPFLGKEIVRNESANEFLKEERPKLTNKEILQNISDSFYQLSPLTSEEVAILTDILDRHNLLNYQLTDPSRLSCTEKRNHAILLNGLLKITDLSPIEQSQNDDYDIILGNPLAKHIYKVELIEYKASFTVRFSNYVFGNLCIDKSNRNYNEESLISACSRKNVVKAILNNFGFISEKSYAHCSSKHQTSMLIKLVKSYPSILLKRLDGSTISVLKVGTVTISRTDKIAEKLDQYLIFSNSRYYLCYGKINFNLARIIAEYKDVVANILLGYDNLNESIYIGSLICNKIFKSKFPFGKPATSVLT